MVFVKLFSGIKQYIAKSEFSAALTASFVTFIISPFTIYLGFSLNQQLARAQLSIEYVYFEQNDDAIDQSDELLESLIERLMEHSMYAEFLSAEEYSPSIRQFGNGSKKRARAILLRLKSYISKQKVILNEDLELLPKSELVQRAFRYDISLEGDAEILTLLETKNAEIMQDITRAEGLIEDIELSFSSMTNEVLVNLNVLNKGSTDGLVRNIGSMMVDGKSIRLLRAPMPSDNNQDAIPVREVNPLYNNFSPNAVGRVMQNTMSDMWFKASTSTSLCGNKNDHFEVILFDQNNEALSKKIMCEE